jgi:hypothetical protein
MSVLHAVSIARHSHESIRHTNSREPLCEDLYAFTPETKLSFLKEIQC